MGDLAYSGVHGLTSALREVVTPHTFFEALGIRYAGPIDGHDIAGVEQALANASEWPGPIVVHVLTQKGPRLRPGRGGRHPEAPRLQGQGGSAGSRSHRHRPDRRMQHGTETGASPSPRSMAHELPVTTFTDAFTRSLLRHAESDPRIVAITAAMPGPTGLLPSKLASPNGSSTSVSPSSTR